ncbi:MAG: carbon starvation protein A [Lentisphaeria bacterium]|nr:carbon starvation protein A [Lentisphaeria bacterium]
MKLFLTGMAVLIAGYFLYGKVVRTILAPDDRITPAVKNGDGVDFVILPNWKNMLIQLLNIAGIGPVIGVIIGIRFGEAVFLIIPAGCILMGAVHDYVAGMMSIRHNGANLPELVRLTAGRHVARIFSVFLCIALLLVVAVFVNVPAKLATALVELPHEFLLTVLVIFAYYVIATLFPVDKIIGRIYPLFGMMLLLGTAALLAALLVDNWREPGLLTESAAFAAKKFTAANNMPLVPMLFVTIACGILSGFHATQAPIVARTMKSEKQGFGVFFRMMAVEGGIAMIWAAGALAVYNKFPELIGTNPNGVLARIADTFLHDHISTVVVISVIILAVTSGDTAMRSLRLSLAESFHVDQKPILLRLMLTGPLIAAVAGLLLWSNKDAGSFNVLWTYFAWANQVIAAFALLAGSIYLFHLKRPAFITVIPGMFITFVVTTYILWTSPEHGGPIGLGLELRYAYLIAGFVSLAVFGWARVRSGSVNVNG